MAKCIRYTWFVIQDIKSRKYYKVPEYYDQDCLKVSFALYKSNDPSSFWEKHLDLSKNCKKVKLEGFLSQILTLPDMQFSVFRKPLNVWTLACWVAWYFFKDREKSSQLWKMCKGESLEETESSYDLKFVSQAWKKKTCTQIWDI